MLRFHILTLFPEFFVSPLQSSILGRAHEKGLVEFRTTDIREFSGNKHNRVDDVPFGGGGGMVIRAEPVVQAIEAARDQDPELHVIYLTPKGRPFNQNVAQELAEKTSIGLVCGHYEGIDARAESAMDDQISIGDFVLTGGEIGALTVIDAVTRLKDGVLGNPLSNQNESHTGRARLEYPHYTRPRTFRGMDVPEILLSGNHGAIEKWRSEKSVEETYLRRPDLLDESPLDREERAFLEGKGHSLEKKWGKKT